MTAVRRRSVGAASAAISAALAALALAGSAQAAGGDPAGQVNPLAGSLGSGFPMVGASAPFGMLQLGPDTGLADGSGDPVNYDGYGYQDQTIRGFSLTHFDGAGVPIAGDVPFMPTVGAVTQTDPSGYASPFSHASESSSPGYYAATLAGSATRVELTAATRAGMMRATYPSTPQANVIVNPSFGIAGAQPGGVTVVGDRELHGWTRSGVGYRLYFTAIFNRPFSGYGTWHAGTIQAGSRSGDGGYVSFDTTGGERSVTMRVAISYVDQAGADGNLAAEIPAGRGFDAERAAARAHWNARLDGIEATGGDPGISQTFYTNLYRTLLMPSVLDDVDGRYPGFDGQIHQVPGGTHHYTSLSLWDTYRTQTPLLELIEPRVAHDIAISLLDDYDQNGRAIPRWVQANVDRGIMGGDSGSATLADIATSGVLGASEARRAYAAVLHQATALPPLWPREHLDAYLSKGYIPNDVSGIGAAETQEYAIDDAAAARLATRYGTPSDASALTKRAAAWRNLLDPSSRYIRPRNSDGSWANPTTAGPATVPWSPNFQDGYQEGTGWQYLWAEPQDVAGLSNAIGGRSQTRSRLDTFFSTALNNPTVTTVPTAQQYGSAFGVYYIGDQYTPANEPDLWSGWYYDWLGQPWKAAKVVRAEMGTYNSRPDGLPGNDDTGTMSAWYVLAALGIYHVTPGVPAYELSSSVFDSVVIHPGAQGRTFTIRAPGSSTLTPYISSAALDAKPFERTYLTTCELRRGGTLDQTLAAEPNRAWASSPAAAPPSLSDAATPAPLAACG